MENRSQRKVKQGIVTSNKMQKTVVVAVERRMAHPVFGKVITRKNKLKAHDEKNECQVGDKVEVIETRPLSKEKCWRVAKIIEKHASEEKREGDKV